MSAAKPESLPLFDSPIEGGAHGIQKQRRGDILRAQADHAALREVGK